MPYYMYPHIFSYTIYMYYDLTVDFEAGFIRLLDKLTNGSKIEVNETGGYQLLDRLDLFTWVHSV